MSDEKSVPEAGQERPIIELDLKPEAKTLMEKIRQKLERMRREDPNIYPLY